MRHIEFDLPIDISERYIKEALCAVLYHQEKMELKQAREYLRISRREFEEDILPQFGFSIYDDSNIDLEINNVRNRRK